MSRLVRRISSNVLVLTARTKLDEYYVDAANGEFTFHKRGTFVITKIFERTLDNFLPQLDTNKRCNFVCKHYVLEVLVSKYSAEFCHSKFFDITMISVILLWCKSFDIFNVKFAET